MNRRIRRQLQLNKAAREDDPEMHTRLRNLDDGQVKPNRGERRPLAQIRRRSRL